MAVDPSAQQVEAEPAPLILVFRLRAQQRSAKSFADILGLYKASLRCNPANCPHRQGGAIACVHECSQERGGVFAVWVPMAVETAETRRRQRLVDRSEHIDRRIPPRDH